MRTTRIPDLPGGLDALVDLLPDARPLAWVRRGDGLVGWGEARRLETWGPGRCAAAEAAWHETLARAVVIVGEHTGARRAQRGPMCDEIRSAPPRAAAPGTTKRTRETVSLQ